MQHMTEQLRRNFRALEISRGALDNFTGSAGKFHGERWNFSAEPGKNHAERWKNSWGASFFFDNKTALGQQDGFLGQQDNKTGFQDNKTTRRFLVKAKKQVGIVLERNWKELGRILFKNYKKK